MKPTVFLLTVIIAACASGCVGMRTEHLRPTSSIAVAHIEASAWQKTSALPFRGKQDDVFFLNPKQGWYGNGEGKLFGTSDGGTTWNLLSEKKGTFIRTLAFLDDKHGYIGNIGTDYFPNVSDETPLYETRDGGLTLTEVKLPAPVKGLCAIDVLRTQYINQGVLATRVVINAAGRVGGPAQLVRSLDGGASWRVRDMSADAAAILDVKFFNEREGFVLIGTHADVAKSRGAILRTQDGGVTWKEVFRSARDFEIMWKVSFPTREIGYATIQSYDPDVKNVRRYIAKTMDGGLTWKEIPLVDDHKVREFGIGFVTPEIGWVGAADGAYQTTDGGATWKPISNEAIGRAINKIRIVNDANGKLSAAFAIGTHVSKFDLAGKR
jgi:photosystem II stability/assembly factor-like uncharacterized protein